MANAQNRIYGVRINYRLLSDFLCNVGDINRAKAAGNISPEFEKRIMLAVTQVNGCRMCSYHHTQEALKMGMDASQISGILGGDLASAPKDEAVALVFAQHYAETIGRYDADAWDSVMQTYGSDTACAIRAYIRVIMVGNAQGNIAGALKSRLSGKPEPNSTVWREIGVLSFDIVVIPFLLIKMAILAIGRKITAIFNKD